MHANAITPTIPNTGLLSMQMIPEVSRTLNDTFKVSRTPSFGVALTDPRAGVAQAPSNVRAISSGPRLLQESRTIVTNERFKRRSDSGLGSEFNDQHQSSRNELGGQEQQQQQQQLLPQQKTSPVHVDEPLDKINEDQNLNTIALQLQAESDTVDITNGAPFQESLKDKQQSTGRQTATPAEESRDTVKSLLPSRGFPVNLLAGTIGQAEGISRNPFPRTQTQTSSFNFNSNQYSSLQNPELSRGRRPIDSRADSNRDQSIRSNASRSAPAGPRSPPTSNTSCDGQNINSTRDSINSSSHGRAVRSLSPISSYNASSPGKERFDPRENSSIHKRGFQGEIMGPIGKVRLNHRGVDKEVDIDDILHRTSKRLREIQQENFEEGGLILNSLAAHTARANLIRGNSTMSTGEGTEGSSLDGMGRELVLNKIQNLRDRDCNLPAFTATLENDSYDLHSALCRYFTSFYSISIYLWRETNIAPTHK